MSAFYRWNTVSRMAVLLLVPLCLRWFNLAFLWHSIYWGAITLVVMIWGAFILLSPLLGRIGCGWFCFIGTVQDLVEPQAFFKARPGRTHWSRALMIAVFFGTAGLLGALHGKRDWKVAPHRVDHAFDAHDKKVWIYDTSGALVFGLLLRKRWLCRHLCTVGGLCALGARHSRLVLELDPATCTSCGHCERDCPVALPILALARKRQGLVVDAECLQCGKCADVCAKRSLRFAWVWNRRKRARQLSEIHARKLETLGRR
jgi:ferredoxin-type protein NapH